MCDIQAYILFSQKGHSELQTCPRELQTCQTELQTYHSPFSILEGSMRIHVMAWYFYSSVGRSRIPHRVRLSLI